MALQELLVRFEDLVELIPMDRDAADEDYDYEHDPESVREIFEAIALMQQPLAVLRRAAEREDRQYALWAQARDARKAAESPSA